MAEDKIEMLRFSTAAENDTRKAFAEAVRQCPIPDDELQENIGLFLTTKLYSRLKFLDHLYSQIVATQGVIFDFGTRWGQNMAFYSTLRGLYEPFNRNRVVVGFDTFEGFIGVNAQDGASAMIGKGKYSVTEGYETWLAGLMQLHEKSNPLEHVKKHQIIKGDAGVELAKYLEAHPETVVAMAYFDMDLYQPTKECLQLILPYLTKGSVIGFDELNAPECPGETVALREVLGLGRYQIRRLASTSRTSYIVIE